MNETKYFEETHNDPMAPAASPVARRRLAGMAAVFLLAILAVLWVEVSSWGRMDQLKSEFAAVHLDAFRLGMRMREGLQRLNGALFRFQLSEDAEERAGFQAESLELTHWIGRTKANLLTARERDLVAQLEESFTRYLQETSTYLERGMRGIRRDTSSRLHHELMEKAQPVLTLADQLVLAQGAAWDGFFVRSHNAMGTLQWLLAGSLLLVGLALGAIAMLVYRSWVAPLRVQLHESRDIIQRQEKLASLGMLAAGVAHELRNPLTAIKIRLFSLRQILPGNLADHEDITVIQSQIQRLGRIVTEFLRFARPAEPQWASLTTNQLLQSVGELLGGELNHRGIQLDVASTEPMSIRADMQQLQQVLINLVQNAADSIGSQGRITLTARQGAAADSSRSQPVVMIDVIDTGGGIPPEAQARLFDPFFSTKENGTGLGLAIAARILQKHGGAIHYSTRPGHGTTFTLVLPKIANHEGQHPVD